MTAEDVSVDQPTLRDLFETRLAAHEREHALLEAAASSAWVAHTGQHDLHAQAHDREHAQSQLAIDKSEAWENEHFAQLNEANARAKDERGTFATKVQLDDKADALTHRLEVLERASAASSGRDHGISVSWAVVLGGLGGVALVWEMLRTLTTHAS